VKNQISLPDFSEGVEPEHGRHEFIQSKPPQAEPLSVSPGEGANVISSEVGIPFTLEKGLFKTLLEDYGINRELEDMVAKRVAETLESRWEEERQKWAVMEKEARERGHAEGYAAGQDKAAQEYEEYRLQYWNDFSDRLNGVCTEILKEKENILHDHERLWCRGTINVLKRFQVGRAIELGRELDRWLAEAVHDFASKKKIKIFVSEDEYARFCIIPVTEQQKWELFPDPNLKNGETRYESEGGGIFLDPSEEFKKLEALIGQYDI
jgi:flagellar biosynthesis/type III secretory pathway protein FliH